MGNMFGKRPAALAVAEQSPRPSKRPRTDHFNAKNLQICEREATGDTFGKRQVTGAVAEQSSRPSKRARTDGFSAKKYEVFISHRGPDVKHSLAYHISDLLEHRGIQAFFDIKEMEAGQTVPQQIQEAIESSKVQIVIFSERFAESKWCLDELAMMIEKHRDGTSIVIPIFYDVQPYEVRFLKGNFGQNFMNKHPKRQAAQKIEEWKKALQEASEISGFCFSELRGAIVDKVVTKVCNYLQIGILHVPDNVVGIEQLLTEKVNHILDGKKQGCGLTCVEITGIGGIGKTTFSYALYNAIRMHFKRCCFIEDVKDKMEKDGPLQIHKTLLKDLFYIDTQSSNIAQAKAQLKKYIENEDVLIVLDDIDLKSRVSDIFVQDGAFLAPTSVIIVTSRDSHILKNDMAFCKSREVIRVEIQKLLLNQSKKVFCEYAFGAADFKYDNIYEHLVHNIVKKCDGIPLALKLFGRHVSGKDMSYWECFWEDIHDSLPGDLKEVLQSTFKSLDSELAKQIFLDVAIFFHGEKVELLENIWVDDPDRNKCHFKVAFEKLKEKFLVEIKWGQLSVHDVLRDMAKAIVDEESELEPGCRSRLWRPHDVKCVLYDEMRTEKVKGMRGLWIKKDSVNPCSWSTDVFVGMSSLKVLIVEGKCIHGDLSKLPRGLLFLRWRNYPYSSVPIPLKFMRVLDLSSGHQEYFWESHAEDAPVELRQLILHECSRIQKLPEWTEKLRWLEKVDLSYCCSLRTIPESFGLLQGLEELKLDGCRSLRELPETLGRLKMLQVLSLGECSSLEDIPESFSQLEKLRKLYLYGCDHLKSLPDSFGHLKSLAVLWLSGCKRLGRLPPSIFMLPALEELLLDGCGSLEPIGERIASLTTLKYLYLQPGKAKNDNSLASGSNYLLLNSSASATVEDPPHNIGDLCNLETLTLDGFSQANIIAPYNSSLLYDAVDRSSNPIGISSPKCSFFPLKLDDKHWVVGGDKKEESSFIASAIFLIIGNHIDDRPFCVGVSTTGTYREHQFWNEGEATLLQIELFTDNPKKTSAGMPVVTCDEKVVKGGWICYLETEGEIFDDNEKVWDYFANEYKRHLCHSFSTVSSDLPTTVVVWNHHNTMSDPSPIALMKHILNPY